MPTRRSKHSARPFTSSTAATLDTANRPAFIELQTAVAAYIEAFHTTMVLYTHINDMVFGTLMTMGDQVQEEAEAIKASGVGEQRLVEELTISTLDQTGRAILMLAIGGTLIGAGISWFTGRGIARPVVRLSAAMRSLSEGDNKVAILGVERGDEIGAMAKAVDVFKQNAIEMEGMRGAQEEQAEAGCSVGTESGTAGAR